jgi:Ferritin-like domain
VTGLPTSRQGNTAPNQPGRTRESEVLATASDLQLATEEVHRMSENTTSRAAFLSRGARGGIALVAGGSLLAATTGQAFGATTTDTDIAKLAATAELLAIDFYGKALKSGKFSGAEQAYMAAALQNEKDHYKALAGVLKAAAPKSLMFKYPAGAFATAKSIGGLGQALETAFVGAYLGAVTALKSNELKGVAAQIGNNESRHLAILSNIAAGTIVSGPSFPKALTAAQATKAVTPFVG